MKAVKVATTDMGWRRFYAIVPNAVRAENIDIAWTKAWDGKQYPAFTNSRTGKAYDWERLDGEDLKAFVAVNKRPYGNRMFTEEFAKKWFCGELDDETYKKVEKDCALYRWKEQAVITEAEKACAKQRGWKEPERLPYIHWRAR